MSSSSQSSPHYKGVKQRGTNKYVEDENKSKVTIYPQALDIIWGGDDRYWKKTEDRNKPVELVQVCWLEVTGSIELEKLEKSKTYTLEFHVELNTDAFGWNNCPVYAMVKMGGQKGKWRKFYLVPSESKLVSNPKIMFTTESEAKQDQRLVFGLYEIWTGRWKGGLKIHKVIISEATA